MIRPAGIDDLDPVDELEKVCFREHAYKREFLRWILGNADAVTLIWESSGLLTGYVMILNERGQTRVISIAVHPAHRRRGIGRALLHAAERIARSHGAHVVRLEVSTKNAPAIALYRDQGYRTDGVLPRYYSWGDDAYAMWKRLETNP